MKVFKVQYVPTAAHLDDIPPYFDGIYKTKKLAKKAKALIQIKHGKKAISVQIKKLRVRTRLKDLKLLKDV